MFNPEAVSNIIQTSECDYLIHGHTHRPADHGKRLVLGAWPDENAIIKLTADQTTYSLNPLRFLIFYNNIFIRLNI